MLTIEFNNPTDQFIENPYRTIRNGLDRLGDLLTREQNGNIVDEDGVIIGTWVWDP